MARRFSYKKRDLQVACSKVKSKIISDIESLSLDASTVTKTYIYNEVAKKLKLKSGSAFHKEGYKYYEYVNQWYEGVEKLIGEYISPKPEASSIENSKKNNATVDIQVADQKLMQELRQKNLMIEHLNRVIRELRMENESLRLRRIHRLHNLDTDKASDTLDENMTSKQIKDLYELISNIYNATFNQEQ